jgi:hypothetical protein
VGDIRSYYSGGIVNGRATQNCNVVNCYSIQKSGNIFGGTGINDTYTAIDGNYNISLLSATDKATLGDAYELPPTNDYNYPILVSNWHYTIPKIDPYILVRNNILTGVSYDYNPIETILLTEGETSTTELLNVWKPGKSLVDIRKARHAILDLLFFYNQVNSFITTKENLGIITSEKTNMKVVKAGSTVSLNNDFTTDTGIYGNLSEIGDILTITYETSSAIITKTGETTYDVSGGNASGSYNEGDKVSIFGYNFYLGGVSSDGVMTGYSLGDPHIMPIKGSSYELPNKVANYRMVQGKGVIVNASTRKLTKEEGLEINRYYEEKYGEEAPKELINDGVFYDKLFIKSKDYEFVYDLKEMKGNMINPLNKLSIEKKEGGIIVNLKDKEISIGINYYSNPQIKYGINCNVREVEGLSGLLIKEYIANTMEVSELNSIGIVKGIRGKNNKLSVLRK